MQKKFWYPVQNLPVSAASNTPITPLLIQQAGLFYSFLTNFCSRIHILGDCLEIEITSKYLPHVAYFLKYHYLLRFEQLVDIAIQDTLRVSSRFLVHYNFLSIYYNVRLRLLVGVNEVTPLFSLQALYPSSSWAEREAWDLFGLVFLLNNDLRRILTDYGFQGFPLRKDFPLTGFYEVLFDEAEQTLKKVPVSLAQDLRLFSL